MPERSRRHKAGEGYPSEWRRDRVLAPTEPSQQMLEDAEAWLLRTINDLAYIKGLLLWESGVEVLPAEMGGLVQKIVAKALDMAVDLRWVKPVSLEDQAMRAIPEKILTIGASTINRSLPFSFGTRQVEMATDAGVVTMADQLVVVGEGLDSHLRRQAGVSEVLAVSIGYPEEQTSRVYVRPSPKSPDSLARIQVTDLTQSSRKLLALLRGQVSSAEMVSDPWVSQLYGQ